MRYKRIYLTMLFTIILLHSLTIIKNTSSQNMGYIELTENYIIQKYGGNLLCKMEISIYGAEDQLNIIFPIEFGEKIVVFRAYYDKQELRYNIIKRDDITEYRINIHGLPHLNRKRMLYIEYLIPAFMQSGDGYSYKLSLPYYPDFNYNVSTLNITIELPEGVEPTEYPRFFTKKTIGKGQIMRSALIGYFTGVEVYEKRGRTIDVTLDSKEYVVIQNIIVKYLLREVHLKPDGDYTVKDYIKFTNLCGVKLDKGYLLRIYKPDNVEGVSVFSSVGEPLKISVETEYISIPLPYSLDNLQNIMIIVTYDVKPFNITVEGFIPYLITLNIETFVSMDYFIKALDIKIYSISRDLILREHLEKIYGQRKFNYIVQDKASLYYIVNQISFLAMLPVLLGFIIFMVTLPTKLYVAKKELKHYLDIIYKVVLLMKEITSLEDEYLEKRISSKDYMKRRGGLHNKLLMIEKQFKEIETKLKHENITIPNILLENVNLLWDKWEELKELEKKFLNRKLKPTNYKNKRRLLVTDLKIIITKLESIIK